MIGEKESEVVIAMAKAFMDLMCRIDPEWQKGFFRFSLAPGRSGSVASYVARSNATIIDPFKNSQFFDAMNDNGSLLMSLLNKEAGVFLVSISNDFTYKVDFDFSAPDRWRISKFNGGAGIPEGFDNR